ncbi:MAG: hypothetical protein P8X63_14480 [Desulfuromonadaceae bacterium]
MKLSFLLLLVGITVTGCSTAKETYILDREFGRAQIASWDKMIAYPEAQWADRQPEGLAGIHAEPAMEVYHHSFQKAPTPADVIQLGIVND